MLAVLLPVPRTVDEPGGNQPGGPGKDLIPVRGVAGPSQLVFPQLVREMKTGRGQPSRQEGPWRAIHRVEVERHGQAEQGVREKVMGREKEPDRELQGCYEQADGDEEQERESHGFSLAGGQPSCHCSSPSMHVLIRIAGKHCPRPRARVGPCGPTSTNLRPPRWQKTGLSGPFLVAIPLIRAKKGPRMARPDEGTPQVRGGTPGQAGQMSRLDRLSQGRPPRPQAPGGKDRPGR